MWLYQETGLQCCHHGSSSWLRCRKNSLLVPFDSIAGGVVEEWGDNWPGRGQEFLHHHRPQPDYQAGASVRHGQLHVRGEEHRGQKEEHHSHGHCLWWVWRLGHREAAALSRRAVRCHSHHLWPLPIKKVHPSQLEPEIRKRHRQMSPFQPRIRPPVHESCSIWHASGGGWGRLIEMNFLAPFVAFWRELIKKRHCDVLITSYLLFLL